MEHDHHYLQLNQVLETCKKQLIDLEAKVIALNVKLGHSQSEVAHILLQLTAAYSVWGRAWGFRFKLGIKQLHEFLLNNP